MGMMALAPAMLLGVLPAHADNGWGVREPDYGAVIQKVIAMPGDGDLQRQELVGLDRVRDRASDGDPDPAFLLGIGVGGDRLARPARRLLLGDHGDRKQRRQRYTPLRVAPFDEPGIGTAAVGEALLDEVLERVLSFAEARQFDDDVCLVGLK